MDAGFEAHLRVRDVTFDERDATLLRAIEEAGSLNAAAESLGRSYSRVQKRISSLEEEIGPLVERRRGGPGGGGSRLTETARDLLAQFDRLQVALTDTAETAECIIRGTVVDRNGELATVETKAGTLSALLLDDATDVHVTIRADSVTLYIPANAPMEAGTSARNRFDGNVAAIDSRESVALVTVAVGDDISVPVLVTRGSLETLSLSEGKSIVATFKATATRATPA